MSLLIYRLYDGRYSNNGKYGRFSGKFDNDGSEYDGLSIEFKVWLSILNSSS